MEPQFPPVNNFAMLPDDQFSTLHDPLVEYRDIFALRPEELGRTDLVQHVINTGDAQPIRQGPYRISPQQQRF